MLIVLLALRLAYAQYTSYNAVAGRLPGRCLAGDFDCGFGRCVPITMFHDGKPDCADGSDEWCFFGQIKCGAYCVDMLHAVSCLFSSKCDNSNRQPPWCSISKEKICGDPSAFPCKGYGECVLWPWLLDGKRHCIDGSDEDRLYVKTLETSFRCFYNRTKKIVMPPPLNYTDRSLKSFNRVVLPSIRPPQYPTLFPPPLTAFTFPNMFLTPPPSLNLPPPAHLSKITGLPALPPPFPTLAVKQSVPVPYSPTKEAISLPNLLTAPDYPFDYPFLQQTTSPYLQNPLDFPDNIISIGQSLQPLHPITPTTDHSSVPSSSSVENRQGIPTKHDYGHIRGRMKSTTPSSSTGRLTHIRVVAGGNEANSLQGGKHVVDPFGENLEHKISDKGSGGAEKAELFSKFGRTSEGNEGHIGTQIQTTTQSTIDRTHKVPGEQLVPFPDFSGPINPKFRTTVRPAVDLTIGQQHSSMPQSPDRKTQLRTTRPPLGSKAVAIEDEDGDLLRTDTTTSVTSLEVKKTANSVESKNENTCLMEMINTSRNQYPYLECQCPVGEMLIDEHCEGRENDLAFYKLDIRSVCGENRLTSDEKKWIAIEKIGETVTAPSCIRMSPNGEAVVNSLCYPRCNLANIRRSLVEKPDSKRSISVEEAPLCDDVSTNFCHRHANCMVEDVRLKCVCKLGTNDTSNGLGRICEGIPIDDCIMILGACLIFWLIILLGLLLLIPLISLLFRFCSNHENTVHPRKEAFGTLKTKKNTDETSGENKHIAALMSTLLAKTAGGQRDLAMKMAMTELELKKSKKNEKGRKAVRTTGICNTIAENHELIPEAVGGKSYVQPITPISINNNTEVKTIESTPGTVHPTPGETPIFDKITSSDIAADAITPAPTVTLVEKISSQQESSLPSAIKLPLSTPSSLPEVISSITNSSSLPHEMVTSSPVMVPTSHAAVPLSPNPSTLLLHQSSSSSLINESLPISLSQNSHTAIPADVEVHRNNDNSAEQQLSHATSTLSTGVQPTIWESYQALGDQYVKRDVIERRRSSDSLETLIESRYPNGSLTTTSVAELQSEKGQHLPESRTVMSQPISDPVTVSQHDKSISNANESKAAHSSLVPDRSNQGEKLAEMLGVTLDTSPTTTTALQPTQSTATVTTSQPPESGSKEQSDEQIVEEISRYGVILPLSTTTLTELPLDEKVVESTSENSLSSERNMSNVHQPAMPSMDATDSKKFKRPRSRLSSRASINTKESDKTKHPKSQGSSRVLISTSESGHMRPRGRSLTGFSTAINDSVRVRHSRGQVLHRLSTTSYDSDKTRQSKREPSAGDSTTAKYSEKVKHPKSQISSRISTTCSDSGFVPTKSLKQTNARSLPDKKPSIHREINPRPLLKPTKERIQSSTDESDPEAATFKKLVKIGRRSQRNLATRKLQRRPQRQLSSISEKSAEIAAEAALQNYQRNYSISAPNTTRPLSTQRRYALSERLDEISDNQTDVDIPSDAMQVQHSTIKRRTELDVQRKKALPPPHSSRKPLARAQERQEFQHRTLVTKVEPTTNTTITAPFKPRSMERSAVVSSPEIPDVTMRRSIDRLNLLQSSPAYNLQNRAFTSRPYVRSRSKSRRKRGETSEEEGLPYPEPSIGLANSRSSDDEKVLRSKVSMDDEMPHSSRTLHHALISRKIATRRCETHVTKSTSDLAAKHSKGTSMNKLHTTCRSHDNLCKNLKWNSSFYPPNFSLHSDAFLSEFTGTRRSRKSRSVLNSPTGYLSRTSSKFSLGSLPMRSSSTIEFSPYFIPGVDGNKPPKEELWWENVPRSKDGPFR